jgi:type IV pilus assembly protein PilA
MAIIKKITKRGFTLIELMIVVVIIGILASLAIYGVQKYVANSKSAEAKTMLGRISKDMLAFFEGENQTYKVLGFNESADITRSLCPDAAGVPTAATAPPKKAKAMPADGSFRDGAGWECMGTTWSSPTYYTYSVDSDQAATTLSAGLSAAAADDEFTAKANGDLDGDDDLSTFSIGGKVLEDNGGAIVLTLATTVEEINPEE